MKRMRPRITETSNRPVDTSLTTSNDLYFFLHQYQITNAAWILQYTYRRNDCSACLHSAARGSPFNLPLRVASSRTIN